MSVEEVRNMSPKTLMFFLSDEKHVKAALKRDFINRKRKAGQTVEQMDAEVEAYKAKLRKFYTGKDRVEDIEWPEIETDPTTGKPRVKKNGS